MRRKKIIKNYGFSPLTVSPLLCDNPKIFILVLLLSTFISMVFSTITLGSISGISLFLGILITLFIWYLSEKVYKKFKNPWVKKLQKYKTSLEKEKKDKTIEIENHKKYISIVSREKITAQCIRELIYKLYDITKKNVIEKIESKDEDLIILFNSEIKKEIIERLKKELKERKNLLQVIEGKINSFKKMVVELGFNIEE